MLVDREAAGASCGLYRVRCVAPRGKQTRLYARTSCASLPRNRMVWRRATANIAIALALGLYAASAVAALDCSGIAGCTKCALVAEKKASRTISDEAGLTVCQECASPGYVLKAKKGICGEFVLWVLGFVATITGSLPPCFQSPRTTHTPAPPSSCGPTACTNGYSLVRSANGTSACQLAAEADKPAEAHPSKKKASLPKPQPKCPEGTSITETNRKGEVKCLCKAGYYLSTGGLAPVCSMCPAFTYSDAPNRHEGCKACDLGFKPNANHTACGECQSVGGSIIDASGCLKQSFWQCPCLLTTF